MGSRIGQGPASHDWRAAAACAALPADQASATFLADPIDPDTLAAARSICATCPVRRPCLDLALTGEAGIGPRDRAGIYAGRTPLQRYGLYLARQETA